MDIRAVLAFLAVLVAIVTTESADKEKGQEETAALEDGLIDKRPSLMRYGRGGLLRYGRGSLMRWGKRGALMRYGRGSIFRYGKRADEETDGDFDSTKRLFRWGKRSDGAGAGEEGDAAFKRLFRWGKRSDDDMAEEKRRHIFRYGKRAGDDLEDDLDDYTADKRIFRYGKRADDEDTLEEIKRRIMRYGRDTRAPQAQAPHVPFRFGEEEE